MMTPLSDNNFLELSRRSALVSCEWLHQNLDRHEQVILDASFFLPRQQRNPKEEFKVNHIPGAHFFDIDEIADLQTPLPHTLPSVEQFSRQVGQLGIDNQTDIIIYDENHFFASARAWWMFRGFGYNKVNVLDGGLKRWKQLSYPMSDDMTKPKAKQFESVFRPELYVDLAAMQAIQHQGSMQILDARSEDSFNGQRPLYDPNIKSGHIPGSINIPYQRLYIEHDYTLQSEDQLIELFLSAKVNLDKPVVTTCGSGVSAAVLLLALYELGFRETPMYDGSWAEWGSQVELPK